MIMKNLVTLFIEFQARVCDGFGICNRNTSLCHGEICNEAHEKEFRGDFIYERTG
jgi:hypothetical protein